MSTKIFSRFKRIIYSDHLACCIGKRVQNINVRNFNISRCKNKGACDNQIFKENLRDYCKSHVLELGAVQAITWPHLQVSEDSSKDSYVDTEPKDRPKDSIEKYFKLAETFTCEGDPKWTFRWFTAEEYGRKKALYVPSDSVFWKGYQVLEKYVNDESLSDLERTAVSALENFYSDRAKHEESLKTLQEMKLTETGIASLLAHHFLAKLLPHPINYYLDKFSKGETDECPCGCGGTIQFGLTSIGSPQLFYGSADIVLFPTARLFVPGGDGSGTAVFTLKKDGDNEAFGDDLIQDDWNQDSELGDEEIATDKVQENTFRYVETWRQLYKQAVSLSFCKRKKILNGKSENNPDLCMMKKSCIMPVCGISDKSYDIVLYDAENDYLLSTFESSTLFDGDRLTFSSIVDIWMIVYHHLFCLGLPPRVQSSLYGTCALQKQIGKEKCRDIIETSQWFYRMDDPGKKKRVPVEKRLAEGYAPYTEL